MRWAHGAGRIWWVTGKQEESLGFTRDDLSAQVSSEKMRGMRPIFVYPDIRELKQLERECQLKTPHLPFSCLYDSFVSFLFCIKVCKCEKLSNFENTRVK